MSKVMIDREELEFFANDLALHGVGDIETATRIDALLCAPSGTPELPVKAYYYEAPNEHGGFNKSVGLEVRKAFTDAPLVLESDALMQIACLEGEIAKRDAKYQREVYGLNNEGDPIGGDPAGGYANDNMRLRAELAAIKAQEPVAWVYPDQLRGLFNTCGSATCAVWNKPAGPRVPLYAAPVSEAKAQGVVMPERRREAETDDEFSAWVRGWNACLDEVARLNAAPVVSADSPNDFWGWLDSAYRAGSKGECAKFTKYNMEVAYHAGRVSAEQQGVVMPDELAQAFITGESCNGEYRVVIKSETLKEMQAVHGWLARIDTALSAGKEGE